MTRQRCDAAAQQMTAISATLRYVARVAAANALKQQAERDRGNPWLPR
jgi:hypothetical protein